MLVLRSLGIIWWCGGFVVVMSWFLVRKACYGWRPLLMEGPLSGLYSPLNAHELRYLLRPNPEYDEAMRDLTQEENYGALVRDEFVTPEETDFILDELPNLIKKYGRSLTAEQRCSMSLDLERAGIESTFVDKVKFISDAYEDPRDPKGVWGIGDAMRIEDLPPLLRRLSNRVQENYPTIGCLRHVYVQYSPDGKFYMPPRAPHPFFGHDFVIIPVARRRAETDEGGIVITLSPNHRSKYADIREVLQSSWSGRDLDVYTPFRGIARFYATARFRCGWGIRPVQYFGHPLNPLPLDPLTFRSKEHHVIVTYPRRAVLSVVWATLWGICITIGKYFALLVLSSGTRPNHPQQHEAPEESQKALIALYFEGPVSETETRNRLRRWEMYAYGTPPTKDSFNWSADTPPTEQEVATQWWEVPLFMARHFFEIGRAGGS